MTLRTSQRNTLDGLREAVLRMGGVAGEVLKFEAMKSVRRIVEMMARALDRASKTRAHIAVTSSATKQ
jgi:hypothetical protein